MADSKKPIIVTFEFDPKNSVAKVKKVSSAFEKMSQDAQKSRQALQGVSAAFTGFKVAALAMTAGAALSVRSFAHYDAALAALRSRFIGVQVDMKSFEDKALSLGARTRFTSTEVLATMEAMRKFGLSQQQILKGIGPVVKLASSENMALAKSAKLVLLANNALGRDAKRSKETLDLLAHTANNSAANIEQLVHGLKLAAPGMRLINADGAQTVKILGILHQSALLGTRSGTAYTAFLSKLAKAAQKGGKVFVKSGLSFQIVKMFDPVTGKKKTDMLRTTLNAAAALGKIKDDAERANAAMQLFGKIGTRQLGKFIDFVKGKNIRDFENLFGVKAQRNVAGFMDRLFAVRQQNVLADFLKLKSSIQNLGVVIPKAFKMFFRGNTQVITGFIGDITASVAFLTQNLEKLEGPLPAIQKLGGKGFVSPGTVALVRDIVVGFKAFVDTLKAGATVFVVLGKVVNVLLSLIGIRTTLAKTIGVLAGLSAVIIPLTLAFVGLKSALLAIAPAMAAFKLASAATAGATALAFGQIVLAIGGVIALSKLLQPLIPKSWIQKASESIEWLVNKVNALREALIAVGAITPAAVNKFSKKQIASKGALMQLESISKIKGISLARKKGGPRTAIVRENVRDDLFKMLREKGFTREQARAELKKQEFQKLLLKLPSYDTQAGEQRVRDVVKINLRLDRKKVAAAVVDTVNKQQKRQGKKLPQKARMNAARALPTPVK